MSEREEFETWWHCEGHCTICHNHKQMASCAWQAAKESSRKQVEELQARIAMQDEALKDLNEIALLRIPDYEDYRLSDDVRDAISATSEDVAAWQEKQLAPLQREVAMLRDKLHPFARFNCQDINKECRCHNCEAQRAMNDTQATAEAYEKEVATKALEDAACWFDQQSYTSRDEFGVVTDFAEDVLRRRIATITGETK